MIRTNRRFPSLLASVLLLAGAGCAAAPSGDGAAATTSASARPALEGSVTDHVVIVSIDGLRPDAISLFGARTLERLMREGSYTLAGQTITPSKTLPSHTSMLTGVEPSVHGVTWNTDETRLRGYITVPTVFSVARAHGLQTAAFFSKTKFRHLAPPGSVDFVWGPRSDRLGPAAADRVLSEVRMHLLGRRPNLMFVHFAQPDFAGHTMGWMGNAYARAVRQADQSVAELIDVLDRRFGRGSYTLIVTSDHGGHGRSHGGVDPRHMTIPWIVWGEGVVRGGAIARVNTMDTGATALWLLGIRTPAGWQGRPISSVFTTDAGFAGAPPPRL